MFPMCVILNLFQDPYEILRLTLRMTVSQAYSLCHPLSSSRMRGSKNKTVLVTRYTRVLIMKGDPSLRWDDRGSADMGNDGSVANCLPSAGASERRSKS